MRIRPADAARIALGTALLAQPRVPLRYLQVPPTDHSDVAVRVLGARWVAQAALGAAAATRGHRRTVGRLDAGVEATHAASMALLAAASPRWRRAAVASAVLAAAFAVVDVRAARRGGP
jgi:hypothetical protein